MAMEAVAAGRDHRFLELQNNFLSEPGGICQITSSASYSSDQPIIGIQADRNLMGRVGHG